jgi:hypothetical protein
MTTQPEALRLADITEFDRYPPNPGHKQQVAKELRRLHESNTELLKALDNLRSAAYWIVDGGEFAHWVNDKTMPFAAAKELAELAEMVQAAQAIIDKAERTTT